MSHSTQLSFSEFFRDIRLVITAPRQRFAVIRERGASWGSMALLLVPTYFAFGFVGGLYFHRDPFPGYSFFPPLIIAVLAVFLKLYLLHISARMLQGDRRSGDKPGTFRELKVVFGYTGVPGIMALLLALAVFLSIPREIGYLMRDLKVVGISIMVALAIALFIWNLILVVLALRTVYPMRDIRIVAAFILGTALMWIPGTLTYLIMAQPHVDLVFVEPVLHPRILRFFASDPTAPITSTTKISVHVDRLAYKLREPERSEIAAYFLPGKPEAGGAAVVVGNTSSISWKDGDYALGRIIGLPGEAVEMAGGNLRINGKAWKEPYISPEYQAPLTLHRQLGADEFLVLPDNRHLVNGPDFPMVVNRNRILGRQILNRWPFGWWVYRPTIFMQAIPE